MDGGSAPASRAAVPTYRITKPLPEELSYRDGSRYRFHRISGVYAAWSLILRKEPEVPYQAIYLCQSRTEDGLAKMLAEGFDVKEGGAEERVMESLCRRGYAERVPLLS